MSENRLFRKTTPHSTIRSIIVDNCHVKAVIAVAEDGSKKEFRARVRIDTPKEWEYYNNGGILHYVLRQLAAAAEAAA